MTSDEALMLEFQRGSRPALDELFSRYRGPLYGFFRRRLESKERAEDLTQETFLVVIRASARYEALSLFRTYLYGIALYGPTILLWAALAFYPVRYLRRKLAAKFSAAAS